MQCKCRQECGTKLHAFFCAVEHQGASSQNSPSSNKEAPEGGDCHHQAQQPDHTSASHRSSHEVSEGPQVTNIPCSSSLVPCKTLAVPDMLHSVQASQQTLISRLQWATQELEGTSSVDYSTQLCRLIKECTDAIKSTRDLLQEPLPVKFPV